MTLLLNSPTKTLTKYSSPKLLQLLHKFKREPSTTPQPKQMASLLQDTDEGRNKSNDNNPVNSAQEAKTSSGACIRTRMASTSTSIINNSYQDGVSKSTHTGPTSSH